MKSVKVKMLALVLGCIVLSVVLIGTASILNSQRVLVNDSARIMNLECANSAKEIDSVLYNIEQSVTTLSVYAKGRLHSIERFKSDPAYVKEYSDSLLDISMNAAKTTEGALTVYIRYNPAFTEPQSGLFCVKKDNDAIFYPSEPTDLSKFEASDRERVGWFYEPAQNRKGTWMSPYYNKNIQKDMISYVIPIYIKEQFVGVVGMDIDFAMIKSMVDNTKVYKTGYAFLADEDANIIYHKDLRSKTEVSEFNRTGSEQIGKSIADEEGSGESLIGYTYNGEKKEGVFRSLQNNMRFIVTAPAREIEKQADSLILEIVLSTLGTIALGIVLSIFFTRRLVAPLIELTSAAKKIADGDFSVSITHQSKDEVGILAESFRQTVARLHHHMDHISKMAYRDSLTGVRNKTSYMEDVARMDEKAVTMYTQYAVIVFDVNGLKQANDKNGHEYGDQLIIGCSQIICKVFKRSPVYRIGGDEFVVILENHDYEHQKELLNTFQSEIEEFSKGSSGMVLSVAWGIAFYYSDVDKGFAEVFNRADNAMYLRKAEMKSKAKNQEKDFSF